MEINEKIRKFDSLTGQLLLLYQDKIFEIDEKALLLRNNVVEKTKNLIPITKKYIEVGMPDKEWEELVKMLELEIRQAKYQRNRLKGYL